MTEYMAMTIMAMGILIGFVTVFIYMLYNEYLRLKRFDDEISRKFKIGENHDK